MYIQHFFKTLTYVCRARACGWYNLFLLVLWRQATTGQSGSATRGRASSPSHRGKACSSSISCIPHSQPSPPLPRHKLHVFIKTNLRWDVHKFWGLMEIEQTYGLEQLQLTCSPLKVFVPQVSEWRKIASVSAHLVNWMTLLYVRARGYRTVIVQSECWKSARVAGKRNPLFCSNYPQLTT